MNCMHEFYIMYILLIAATKFEIQPTLLLLERQIPHFSQHTISVLITGVGQTNTTYNLTTNLINKKTDIVIQAGIAGTFNEQYFLGQTVLVKQDCFGDLGMEEKEKFTTLFDNGFADKNEFPFTNGWLVNDADTIFENSLLRVANGVTINKVSDSLLQKQQLLNNFNADIESMEGAALHYVCLLQKIPFIQIRSISNSVGERDKTKWAIKDAIVNLNVELEKLINQLL